MNIYSEEGLDDILEAEVELEDVIQSLLGGQRPEPYYFELTPDMLEVDFDPEQELDFHHREEIHYG